MRGARQVKFGDPDDKDGSVRGGRDVRVISFLVLDPSVVLEATVPKRND
jgi:hypothetical protein